MGGGPPTTRAGVVYKATTNEDLVVPRMIQLYSSEGKFHSFHDYKKDPRDRKSWYLDRRCVLRPENAADITDQPKKEREPGTWTITGRSNLWLCMHHAAGVLPPMRTLCMCSHRNWVGPRGQALYLHHSLAEHMVQLRIFYLLARSREPRGCPCMACRI